MAATPEASTYPVVSRHDRLLNMGPWLVGAELDFLLQGILWVMSARYFRQHKNDKRVYYYFVIFINVLSFGKTVQSFLIVWDKFITKFGHYMSLVEDNPTWQATEPLTTSIVGACVQAFFIYRLFKLLGRVWPLYIVILGCSMMGVGGAVWLTVLIYNPPALTSAPAAFVHYGELANQAVTLMLAGVFVADFFITGSMIFHLLHSKGGFESTDGLIDRLVQITWTSALPPTICAVFNLGFYVGQANTSVVHLALNMALSKLYAISAVYTLNARDDLRNWWGAARSYDISRQSGSRSQPQHSSKEDPHRSIAMKIHPRYPSQPQTTTIEIRKETRVDGDPSMDMSPISKSKHPYDNGSDIEYGPRI